MSSFPPPRRHASAPANSAVATAPMCTPAEPPISRPELAYEPPKGDGDSSVRAIRKPTSSI